MRSHRRNRFGFACLGVLLATGAATADMTNGGFESGLTGWLVGGSVFSTDKEYERGIFGDPDWTAQEGDRFAALFSTDNAGIVASTLEQAFRAEAGDVVSFDYFFDFGDEAPYFDSAQVELIGPAGTASLLEFNRGSGPTLGDYRNIGWADFSVTLSAAGDYTLRFAIQDYDGAFESVLGVDNVHVAAVPAPGAAFLGIIGLLLVALYKRTSTQASPADLP